MSYEPELTDVALEDLHALIDSLPASRRRDATDAVIAAIETLAANPRLGQREHLGRPSYHFRFVAGGVTHHWGCTFKLSPDEARITITHVFRVGL